MTNLIASILFTITTNWTTIETTIPNISAGNGATYAVMVYPRLTQMGRVYSNVVASVEWGGKTNQFTLESKEIELPYLMRRTIYGDFSDAFKPSAGLTFHNTTTKEP